MLHAYESRTLRAGIHPRSTNPSDAVKADEGIYQTPEVEARN